MGLLDKVNKGDFQKKTPILQYPKEEKREKLLPQNLVPTTPPEEKIKIQIDVKSGKLKIPKEQMQSVLPSTAVRLPRAQIGIPVIDKTTEGGFIRGSVNLIGGGPGCGKSIFCMQFLVRGIEKFKENGVFISFEQTEEKILQDMSRFNWKLEDKIKDKKLAILYFTPEQVEKVLESGSGLLKDLFDSIKAKRLVIDSLNAFALLYNDETDKRRAVTRLFEVIHKWDITTIATLERESDANRHEASLLEFETDSVILVYNEKKGTHRLRSMEIYKMRGTKHAASTFSMAISDKGITVGADA